LLYSFKNNHETTVVLDSPFSQHFPCRRHVGSDPKDTYWKFSNQHYCYTEETTENKSFFFH